MNAIARQPRMGNDSGRRRKPTWSALALALVLGPLSFTARAVDDPLDVPAVPHDSDWAYVLQTESGLKTYIAKTSLKVLPDRSGFAVWLKLMRPGESSMAPMAAYMLHDCDHPRRMRLNQAVNLRTRAQSAEGKSAWLPDVPISTAIKQNFCPKISKLKAQEERDRAPVSVLANSTIK